MEDRAPRRCMGEQEGEKYNLENANLKTTTRVLYSPAKPHTAPGLSAQFYSISKAILDLINVFSLAFGAITGHMQVNNGEY
ncbi:hypothetical protein NDU88_007968 [Pleurodeles waltl]|uniref:Uncharacterized protein n=1 Tax=Pleurodeles waltl TaxID=8319 RepID=A0AAV7VRX4_PLEWA|nr:hypothetical protein NDU88_007968 [Pleurodeles waltl]